MLHEYITVYDIIFLIWMALWFTAFYVYISHKEKKKVRKNKYVTTYKYTGSHRKRA